MAYTLEGLGVGTLLGAPGTGAVIGANVSRSGRGRRFREPPPLRASRPAPNESEWSAEVTRSLFASDMLDGRNYPLTQRYDTSGQFGQFDQGAYNAAKDCFRETAAQRIDRLHNQQQVYKIPIGIIATLRGANRKQIDLTPAQGILHIPTLPVVVMVAPDPFGRPHRTARNGPECVRGRAFYVSTAARVLLTLAARTRGGFYGYPSPQAWLDRWFSPKVQREIEALAAAQVEATDNAAAVNAKNRATRQKRQRVARQESQTAAAAGVPNIPPALWAAAAVGGLYLWRQRK